MGHKKSIFLIVGNNDALRKQIITAFPSEQTFFASIADQVNNVSTYLLRGNTNPAYNQEAIRARGYKVTNLYWLNLLLSSVSGTHKYIVVTDAMEQDVTSGATVLYIGDDKTNKLGLNMTTMADPCMAVKKLLGL